jgi:hypothetical protein
MPYVGQVVNLRRVVNPPGRLGQAGRQAGLRGTLGLPQADSLPHEFCSISTIEEK